MSKRVNSAIRTVLTGLLAQPLGQASASVYETARLVALAPWLAGHASRISFLIDSQRHDGGWGGPEGYGLAPTLSATQALLATLRMMATEAQPRDTYDTVVATVRRGLRVAFDWLRRPGRLSIPDMPAIELIVPSLVASINEELTELSRAPMGGLDAYVGSGRLGLPAGMDHEVVDAFRFRLRTGEPLPDKLLHALEVAGPDAVGARAVRPTAMGTVGASPAATAAWLGPVRPPHGDASHRHLEGIIARTGGPVPCGVPIAVFERAWILAALSRNDIRVAVPSELIGALDAALDENGAAGGEGLPPDADTTSVVLYALARQGLTRQPTCLRGFELETRYCTWPGEQGASTSVNAHVLEALGESSDADRDTRAMMAKVTTWLCEQQQPDGWWTDRWHASPYYATASCVLALAHHAPALSASMAGRAIKAALNWVLDTQRDDGSWGRWGGTAEETAYAVQVLLAATRHDTTGLDTTGLDTRAKQAADRGHDFLVASMDRVTEVPLWHDKDLYMPTAVTRTEVLGALYSAKARMPGMPTRPAPTYTAEL